MQCGSVLVRILDGGRFREICENCGWMYYEQLKATAGLLVEHEKKVLLVKRAQEPWKDKWYLPAGYLEIDESPEQGAVREVLEETGVRTEIVQLLGIYPYNDDPRGNGFLILYKAIPISEKFILSAESADCAYFDAHTAPNLPLAGMAHRAAILDWVRKNNA